MKNETKIIDICWRIDGTDFLEPAPIQAEVYDDRFALFDISKEDGCHFKYGNWIVVHLPSEYVCLWHRTKDAVLKLLKEFSKLDIDWNFQVPWVDEEERDRKIKEFCQKMIDNGLWY
jgi:hypothetical protein